MTWNKDTLHTKKERLLKPGIDRHRILVIKFVFVLPIYCEAIGPTRSEEILNIKFYKSLIQGLAKKAVFREKSAASEIWLEIIQNNVVMYIFQIKMLLSTIIFVVVVVNSTVFNTLHTGVLKKNKKFL